MIYFNDIDSYAKLFLRFAQVRVLKPGESTFSHQEARNTIINYKGRVEAAQE